MGGVMKGTDIRIEARIRNNALWHAIYDNWESVNHFCREQGFQPSQVGQLLNLKKSPITQTTGKYRKICLRLAKVFGLLVEDLFPLHLYKLEKIEAVMEVSFSALSENQKHIALLPASSDDIHDKVVDAYTVAELKKALEFFKPRTQRIIALRFGLDNGRESTLQEIGDEFGISGTTVTLIIEKALSKLRIPWKFQKLHELVLD